jgi:hypothetical protein
MGLVYLHFYGVDFECYIEIDAGSLVGGWLSNCEIVTHRLIEALGTKRRATTDRGLSLMGFRICKT